jgi:hypothetical protein
MLRMLLITLVISIVGAIVSTSCLTGEFFDGQRTLAFRMAPAWDMNDFYVPMTVHMIEGNGIAWAYHDVDGISVYFYWEGFAPHEWNNLEWMGSREHCGWALRNIPYLSENQVSACGFALMEMRFRELAPDPRPEDQR